MSSNGSNLPGAKDTGRTTGKVGRPPKASRTASADSESAATAVKNIPANCPWKIGQRVEACDSHGNWYPAKILDINNFKLLIHFQRWSSRFDEWFDMDSDLIRVIQDESTKDDDKPVAFEVNDEVLARWTDSKFYPARIVKLSADNIFCHVIFYDGYKKKVKLNTIEKLPPDYAGERLPPKPQPKETFAVVDPINHNEFICDICKKGFRKESLLTQHRKHYHNIVESGGASTAGTNKEAPQQQENSTAITPSNSVEENKEDVKVELAKLNQSSDTTIVKSENLSDDGIEQKEQSPQEMVAADSVSKISDPTVALAPESIGGKKRRKDGRRSGSLGSHASLSSNLKRTKSDSVPPSANPYFYFPEPKSSKKMKPNLVLPFNIQNAKQIADAHENDNIDEIVKCICPIREENGLMVQCELCLAWQHGHCMGFTSNADVPAEGYFCPYCCKPKKARKSQKNCYQLNHWIKEGMDPVFLPAYFDPLPNNSAPQLPNGNGITQSQIMVKLESNSSASVFVTEASSALLSSSNPSLYNSYYPNPSASSFPNQSTITTTTTAANHAPISLVSDSNKAAAVSIGSFACLPNGGGGSKGDPTPEFDLPPSSGIFPSNFMDDDEHKDDKKSFILHDFTGHNNNNADLSLEDDHIGNLIDMNLKDDFFGESKLMDEDELFKNQVKATNLLSSALLDIMNNIHSLNYKITHHKETAAQQIMEKQRMLKENLKLIESKLEKIEKEIEQKDSYAIHTSSSTLTATSPENFGFSDMGLGNSFAVSQTTTTHKYSFPTSMFESGHQGDHLSGVNSTSAMPSYESHTLASLTTIPGMSMDSSSFFPSLSPHGKLPLLPSTSSTTNVNESSIPSTSFKPIATSTESPQMHQQQQPNSSQPLASTMSTNQNQPQAVPPTAQSLARLYIPPGNFSNSNEEQELIENQRPSMTHEYLPVNMSDADLKLEIAYHYKDLNTAREIMLGLK